jgi:hypothetical protein
MGRSPAVLKTQAETTLAALWKGELPALIDTAAQFCLRSDVVEYVSAWRTLCFCLLFGYLCSRGGKKGHVSNAAKLHVGLLSFAWDHEFKVLNEGPFPAIFGLDFLNRTQMRVDIPAGTFSFAFGLR